MDNQKHCLTCKHSARKITDEEPFYICRYDKKEKNNMLSTSKASGQRGRKIHEYDIVPWMDCDDHIFASWHPMSKDHQPSLFEKSSL